MSCQYFLRTHNDVKIFLDKEAGLYGVKIKKDLSDNLCENYLSSIVEILTKINEEEKASIDFASQKISDQIKEDKLIYIFGPGGHSNLASQEVFFRAGGLMHFNAILDEGTLLSNGALRSMAIERTPGYGKIVIENQNLQAGDLLILVNAYGINSALIDAALTAREKGVFTIGISSFSMQKKLNHIIQPDIRLKKIFMN